MNPNDEAAAYVKKPQKTNGKSPPMPLRTPEEKARFHAGSRARLLEVKASGNKRRIRFWETQFTEENRRWLEAYEAEHGPVTPETEPKRAAKTRPAAQPLAYVD